MHQSILYTLYMPVKLIIVNEMHFQLPITGLLYLKYIKYCFVFYGDFSIFGPRLKNW